MQLRISQSDLFIFLMKLCLIISFYHTVLKLAPDSALSLYRIVQPLQVVLLLCISKRRFQDWLAIILLMMLFGTISIILGGYPLDLEYNLVFFLHYISMFLTFFCAFALVENISHKKFMQFLVANLYVFIVFGVLELFSLYSLSESDEGVVRAMMHNENDFSLVLASASIYLLFRSNRNIHKLSIIGISLFICYYNDSRVAFFAVILSLFVYFFLLSTEFGDIRVRYLKILALSSLGLITVFIYADQIFTFIIFGSTILELLVDPFVRIITLEPYDIGWGSLFIRVDSTIFALKDFFATFGFGTGFGNSLKMLETERYGTLFGIGSLHNFPLQLITELGVFFWGVVFFLFLPKIGLKSVVLITMLFFASLSQSAGIFSNYFFLCLLSLAILCPHRAQTC